MTSKVLRFGESWVGIYSIVTWKSKFSEEMRTSSLRLTTEKAQGQDRGTLRLVGGPHLCSERMRRRRSNLKYPRTCTHTHTQVVSSGALALVLSLRELLL